MANRKGSTHSHPSPGEIGTVSATRLVAWRLGPGGAPEQLATGEFEALEVAISADITFTPGSLYQLWVTAKNGRGQSEPSPAVSWTAAA